MNDTSPLKERLAAVEGQLVEQHQTKSLAGFAPLYAALSVAAIVLPWFPAYGAVERRGQAYVHEPLILAPMGYGFLTFLMVAALVSPMLTVVFARRRTTTVIPVLAAAVSSVGAVLLLARFGAVGEPDLTTPGCAMVTILFAITVVSAAHIAVLAKLIRTEATEWAASTR